jgi:hypothetical protein
MVLVAAVLSVYVLRRHRAHLLRYALGPAVIGALLLSYNLYYFGELTGGYGELAGTHTFTPQVLWMGLRGLLISPDRGMLVFSPILLAAFGGMWIVLSRREGRLDDLLAYVAVSTLLAIVQYATFSGWHGAFGFSYRFLAELLPSFILLMVPVWGWLVATTPRRILVGGAICYSVFVQVIGAFYYPCGWYHPESDRFPARYFSWHDTELMQCLRAGPVDPDGLRAIRHAMHIEGGGRQAN